MVRWLVRYALTSGQLAEGSIPLPAFFSLSHLHFPPTHSDPVLYIIFEYVISFPPGNRHSRTSNQNYSNTIRQSFLKAGLTKLLGAVARVSDWGGEIIGTEEGGATTPTDV